MKTLKAVQWQVISDVNAKKGSAVATMYPTFYTFFPRFV